MVGQPDFTPMDLVANDLEDLARALLSARAGAFRDTAIAYLIGDAGVWGDEPNPWQELPAEVRDAMERAACDLALGMRGAEEAAAQHLLTAAGMLAIDDGVEVDASDFSLDFGRREEVA